ncbi:hypothetical protein [Sphingomonas crocodyli]|uniref:Uncharacterized protein n=1 Tax=Sphingomonas crocodyli TaxID=1979270 RepID=A0A437MBH2_9SPHN|nr:hypothetical protein [Sphingomonas crocodyli]RVT95001.1 hypothetical protein EOD43_01820 [Sphingomonas crocodyli]
MTKSRLDSFGPRFLGTIALLLLLAAAPPGRQPIGIFGDWGAFRDPKPRHCYAIAIPETRRSGEWRPFASVAHWPERNIRNQVHFRLREERAPRSPIALFVGETRFPLVAGRVDAWAPDARADAAIVAAMRSGTSMRVAWVSKKGKDRSDGYLLKGVASAIDAAAIGCARR